MAETLYLLDGHAHLYAAYFGITQRLTAPDGRPTNAVFGVVRALQKLLRERKPDHWAVVLDPDGPTFRSTLYTEYKAHRKPMPPELLPQPALLRQVLAAMDVPTFTVDGVEADDVLATLTTRGAAAGLEVFLCSRDKDLGQLLGPMVRFYDLKKDEVVDADRWTVEWGVRPDQVVDFLALMGDASDNIPGAKGIGDKTAAKLITQFGTLDALLAGTATLKGKQRENLEAFKPAAELSRKLVRLIRDVPLEVDWQRLRPVQPSAEKVGPLFRELGFASLLEPFGVAVSAAMTPGDAAEPAAPPDPVKLVPPGTPFADLVLSLAPWPVAGASRGGADATDFDPDKLGGYGPTAEQGLGAAVRGSGGENQGSGPDATQPVAADGQPPDPKAEPLLAQPPAAGRGTYHIVDTPELLADFAARLSQQTRIALDTETTGLDPLSAELVGMSFAWQAGEAFYLPFRGLMMDRVLELRPTLETLRPVLENPAVAKVGQNIKYDVLVLRSASPSVRVAGIAFDTMVAAYCADPARREGNIDALCRDYFGYEKITTESLLGKGKKARRMDEVPVAQVAEYAGEDADFALRLADRLGPELDAAGVRRLFTEVEMPLVDVLADMEAAGVAVDRAMLEAMSVKLETELTGLRGKIAAAAGGAEFNPDSPKQLAEVLFTRLGLKSGRKTSLGAASTDSEVLESLVEQHPLPGLILEHRRLAKLKGTYVDALPKLINARTGRVHTRFNQAVAQTGRLSSSDPNLQNIPIRTPLGRSIRAAFVAGAPGMVLLTADYSQIELRLLAHFSGDDALREAFRTDRDIHRFVAAQVAGVPEEQVTKDQRDRAKAVNFGIIYGQSANGLARATGMSVPDAKKFIADYFGRYPKVKRFIDDCIRLTTATELAATVLGRRRRVPEISDRGSRRSFGERLAVNTVLQGSAADLLKTAMVRIASRIRAESRPSRMLLTIHDELLFEVPESAVESERAMIAAEMTGALSLSVPLKVDVAWGRNWLEVG